MNMRHGGMALIEIAKLPEGLTKSESNILMTGSHGNNHTFVNGDFYSKQVDTFVFGYLVAGKDCELHHPKHGQRNPDGTFIIRIIDGEEVKATLIPEGRIFKLKKQQEQTHEGMKSVID